MTKKQEDDRFSSTTEDQFEAMFTRHLAEEGRLVAEGWASTMKLGLVEQVAALAGETKAQERAFKLGALHALGSIAGMLKATDILSVLRVVRAMEVELQPVMMTLPPGLQQAPMTFGSSD